MNKWRLTKLLVVAAAGLALAAGSVAAVASTRDDGGTAQPFAAQEEADGSEQPWLGVLVRPSDDPTGLAVRHVGRESPAAGAGLEPGDVITAIDGEAVSDFDTLAAAIKAKAVGDTVTLSVVKNGVEEPSVEATEVEATLEARPQRAFKNHIGEVIGKAFDRFVDGQFRYLDEDGNTVEVEVVAGTISSVGDTQITLDVNGDDEGERSFDIPDGVTVPEGLAEGDQAAVVIKDGAVAYILPGGFHVPLPDLVPHVFPGFDGGFKFPFGGEGDARTLEVVSGTVSSVSADEITLDLGGDQGEKTFAIPDGVDVPEGLDAGEEATVVVRDGEVAKIGEGALPMDGEFKFPFDGDFFPHPFRGGPGIPFEGPTAEPEEVALEA